MDKKERRIQSTNKGQDWFGNCDQCGKPCSEHFVCQTKNGKGWLNGAYGHKHCLEKNFPGYNKNNNNECESYCFNDTYPKGEKNLIAFDMSAKNFTIGQDDKDNFAKSIKCARCGSSNFNVAIADFYTAIRCIKCKWELCVHEG